MMPSLLFLNSSMISLAIQGHENRVGDTFNLTRSAVAVVQELCHFLPIAVLKVCPRHSIRHVHYNC